jgi:hypothetical protein
VLALAASTDWKTNLKANRPQIGVENAPPPPAYKIGRLKWTYKTDVCTRRITAGNYYYDECVCLIQLYRGGTDCFTRPHPYRFTNIFRDTNMPEFFGTLICYKLQTVCNLSGFSHTNGLYDRKIQLWLLKNILSLTIYGKVVELFVFGFPQNSVCHPFI